MADLSRSLAARDRRRRCRHHSARPARILPRMASRAASSATSRSIRATRASPRRMSSGARSAPLTNLSIHRGSGRIASTSSSAAKRSAPDSSAPCPFAPCRAHATSARPSAHDSPRIRPHQCSPCPMSRPPSVPRALKVRDASMRDSLIRALRADPAIASVSIDRMLTRGPESKMKLNAAMMQRIRDARASAARECRTGSGSRAPGSATFSTGTTTSSTRLAHGPFPTPDPPPSPSPSSTMASISIPISRRISTWPAATIS